MGRRSYFSRSVRMNVRSDPQIETFRSSLASILTGTPVGHAMSERFGARYDELSTLLSNATSPTATAPRRRARQRMDRTQRRAE